MKHYLIYEIKNNVNGKIYIGQHQTDNINDSYMGSGKILKNAIKKYGIENFTKRILFECESEEEMNKKEAEIVNEEFISREDVYNMTVGGYAKGFQYSNKNHLNNKVGQCYIIGKKLKENKEYRNIFSQKIKDGQKRSGFDHNTFLNKHHTTESKQKISSTKKGKLFLNNKITGRMWIKNNDLKSNAIIKKDASIPKGWIKGRNMKFTRTIFM